MQTEIEERQEEEIAKLRDQLYAAKAVQAPLERENELLCSNLEKLRSEAADLRDQVAVLANALNPERFASAQHHIWSCWMLWMFENGGQPFEMKDGTWRWAMHPDKYQRWERQMSTMYSELSPQEQHPYRTVVSEHMPWVGPILADLPSAVAEHRERVARLEAEWKRAIETLNRLQKSYTTCWNRGEGYRADNERLEAEKEQCQERLYLLQSQYEQTESERRRLQSDNERLRKECAEVVKQVNCLQAELRDAKAERAAYGDKMSSLLGMTEIKRDRYREALERIKNALLERTAAFSHKPDRRFCGIIAKIAHKALQGEPEREEAGDAIGTDDSSGSSSGGSDAAGCVEGDAAVAAPSDVCEPAATEPEGEGDEHGPFDDDGHSVVDSEPNWRDRCAEAVRLLGDLSRDDVKMDPEVRLKWHGRRRKLLDSEWVQDILKEGKGDDLEA